MKLILNIALLCSLIVMNTRGICQTINEGTNPTATRARCTYTFVGGTGNTFNCWILPTSNNAIPVRDDSNAPQYNLLRTTLYGKMLRQAPTPIPPFYRFSIPTTWAFYVRCQNHAARFR